MRADGIEPTGYSRSIRCSHHLFVTTGTATRHSEVRPRRRFHAMWLLARSRRSVSAPVLAAQVDVFRQVAFSDFSTGPPAFPSLRLSEHQRLVHAPAPSVELHEPTVVGDPVKC